MEQPLLNATGGVVAESAVHAFRDRLRGEVIRPGDGGYDVARAVFNGMIDKRPGLIVRCRGVADVIAAVGFAREQHLVMAVRGGGHGIAGNAVCEGGLVIDLSPMKAVRVDPARRTARAEPGVTLGEFDHETQTFELATAGGTVSTTGIAGLTLGGGLGWLGRRHGLTCDNLLAVDLVTADGTFLSASAAENTELFWGVRGGGGNFGVVTSFEYCLHPLGPVLAGPLVHPLARAREALRFARDFSRAAPDELAVYLVLGRAPDGEPSALVIPCYSGPLEEGERLLRPLRAFGPPRLDRVAPVPFTRHQRLFDATTPPGMRNYWKSSFLAALDDEAIDTAIAQFRAAPSPRSLLFIEHVGGAYARVPPEATAFGRRDGEYNLLVLGRWTDPAEDEANVRWARAAWTAMQPYATGAVYVNYLEAGQEGAARVASAYGGNYERLAALKAKYDPTNFFRQNQNIAPGGGRAGEAST